MANTTETNMNEVNDLTHFSATGRARMVDVSDKSSTPRVAVASGVLRMQPATLERIRFGKIAKGDVLRGVTDLCDVHDVCSTCWISGVIVECCPEDECGQMGD